MAGTVFHGMSFSRNEVQLASEGMGAFLEANEHASPSLFSMMWAGLRPAPASTVCVLSPGFAPKTKKDWWQLKEPGIV